MKPEHGFRDYLKNPGLFIEEVRAALEAESAPRAGEKKLAELVAVMKSRPLEHAEHCQLRESPDRAAPHLLDALRDKEFQLHRYGPSVLDGSPMETALDLLEPLGLPSEPSLLMPALQQPEEFGYKALYHLARCGHDDAIDVLRAGLASDFEDCRTWTLMGLCFLKDSPRGSAKFRAAMFVASAPLLNDNEYAPAKNAPRALLALDRARAENLLLGTDVLSSANKRIDKVLQALRDDDVPVPGERLRALLPTIKDRAGSYPFDYAYADALLLLARAEGPRAADLISDAATWGNANVKKGAAEAAQVSAGVENAYRFVCDLYERIGARGLTKPQISYLTLWRLDAEVRNGGFSQYFFNSSGDLAHYAIPAAEVVGALQTARIIHNAIALFGEEGPHPNRVERMGQLAGIDIEALNKLDTEYYGCADVLAGILPMFVANNPDAFKPQ